jgi:hypothetical protein
MTQSLRKNVPRNPIIVGLWGSKDDVEKLRDRFGGARPTAIVTTLRDALQRVKEIDNPAREQTQPAPVPVAAVG